jgi:protein-S-isoprenylcysteine O-methyltransferase Ste14
MARVLSPRLERSAYVWVASVLFLLVMAAWQPVGGVLWDARGTPVLALLAAVQAAGVLVTARASSVLDVLSLAGIRQAEGDPTPLPPQLIRTGLYRWVRHPIYFGWVLMVWPAATMTGTRLTFAAVSTLYLAAAIPLEERALRRRFGRAYDRYATSVRWRMLPGVY